MSENNKLFASVEVHGGLNTTYLRDHRHKRVKTLKCFPRCSEHGHDPRSYCSAVFKGTFNILFERTGYLNGLDLRDARNMWILCEIKPADVQQKVDAGANISKVPGWRTIIVGSLELEHLEGLDMNVMHAYRLIPVYAVEAMSKSGLIFRFSETEAHNEGMGTTCEKCPRRPTWTYRVPCTRWKSDAHHHVHFSLLRDIGPRLSCIAVAESDAFCIGSARRNVISNDESGCNGRMILKSQLFGGGSVRMSSAKVKKNKSKEVEVPKVVSPVKPLKQTMYTATSRSSRSAAVDAREKIKKQCEIIAVSVDSIQNENEHVHVSAEAVTTSGTHHDPVGIKRRLIQVRSSTNPDFVPQKAQSAQSTQPVETSVLKRRKRVNANPNPNQVAVRVDDSPSHKSSDSSRLNGEGGVPVSTHLQAWAYIIPDEKTYNVMEIRESESSDLVLLHSFLNDDRNTCIEGTVFAHLPPYA